MCRIAAAKWGPVMYCSSCCFGCWKPCTSCSKLCSSFSRIVKRALRLERLRQCPVNSREFTRRVHKAAGRAGADRHTHAKGTALPLQLLVLARSFLGCRVGHINGGFTVPRLAPHTCLRLRSLTEEQVFLHSSLQNLLLDIYIDMLWWRCLSPERTLTRSVRAGVSAPHAVAPWRHC